MLSVPSVVIQKKYECEESPENPELVMHCKKFLLASVSCPGLPSFGFFQELQNTIACTGCKNPIFISEKLRRKKKVRHLLEAMAMETMIVTIMLTVVVALLRMIISVPFVMYVDFAMCTHFKITMDLRHTTFSKKKVAVAAYCINPLPS